MEKSENASAIRLPQSGQDERAALGDMLPFAGLGFDLGPILTCRIRLRVVAREERREAPPPCDAPFPSGRRLQLRLGREIRGR
jgi:hypothetical protein